ncbi:MAG TPA: hypothetical protein VNV13_09260 [Steroidobacteraceae bacterium]|jgi:hypothetical protein|nr:hypothetical protein [Steroidobacteraceae bacterium]
MSKVTAKIKEEFLALLPPTIYFFIALHIVGLVRALLIKATGLSPLSTASIAVAALVLGKSVLIAELLPIINRYPQKPLIYNVGWKTMLYLVVSLFIHYLERLYDFSRQAGGIAAGNKKLLAEMVWPHFWAVQIILALMIFMYCVGNELTRVIGRDRMQRMFFGPLPLPVF